MKRIVRTTCTAVALALAVFTTSAIAQQHGVGGSGGALRMGAGGSGMHMGGVGGMHMGGIGGMHMGGGPRFGDGGRFGDRDFRGRRGFAPSFAVGFDAPYSGDDYDDYFHNECYVVRPVPTPFGWGLRRFWVC